MVCKYQMSNPKISVILTAYNRESYIGDAIESVLHQQFKDFELLIVDDCSTDNTVKIAQQYLTDSRVRIIENKKNLSDYPNRNHALQFARGEYVKYHDSDDIMYPHCLQILISALSLYPEASFSLTGSIWHGGACPMLLSPKLAYQREFLGFGCFGNGPACALFKTKVLKEYGGFTPQKQHSDYYFWLDFCKIHHFVLAPPGLIWFRVHDGQEGQHKGHEDECYIDMYNAAWDHLHSKDCPLDANDLHQAKINLIHLMVKKAYYDIRKNLWLLAIKKLISYKPTFWEWIKYFRRPRFHLYAGTPRNENGEVLIHNTFPIVD